MRLLFVFTLLAFGCSSTDDTQTVADASNDADCVKPAQGAACDPHASLCPFVSECCLSAWSCTDGKWLKLRDCLCISDVGAPDEGAEADTDTFACGTSTCAADQLCRAQAPGIPDAGTSYACASVPKGCESTPTCECVKAKIESCVVDACSVDAQGHLTVSCMGA